MWLPWNSPSVLASTLLASLLFQLAGADNVLTSSGFTNCASNPSIKVNNANVTFDSAAKNILFSVSATSTEVQNVSATLIVSAYGKQVYQNKIDPCHPIIEHLCPAPAGTFSATGNQSIPSNVLSQIPSIAFSVPDLQGDATLTLNRVDTGEEVGCIQAGVTNGKTLSVPAVSYVAAGIAGIALILSGLTAFGNAGTVGNHAPSLGFATIFGWFQSMAMNGMHSVNYPGVYRSFSKNFAFSGGLIPWTQMQTSIDNFRAVTGGNLTDDNVQYLQNASLAFNDGSSNATDFGRRSLGDWAEKSMLLSRSLDTSVNGSSSSNASSSSGLSHVVHGISGYVEELTIPQANTFMTVLLIFAIVIAAITVGILLFKVILETWALFGSFPARLTSFRKRYWHTLSKTIVNLILLLYGVWVLYCIFQFTNGDSWAAKLLAGITLATFTAILAFFTIKIWVVANKYKRSEGDTAALYENKETWIKYSLFYDSYRRGYWWLFMPAIIYMFAKGCVLAAADGHGLTQTAAQLIIESLMFILLLWTRPYATKAGNWINIIIQIIRVLSVICILVFVDELGIAQTTQAITGVVLVAVQSGLTGILAILIAINAIITLCRENPHRKKRKENEKSNREFDNLTPLDARNSLLIAPIERKDLSPGYAMAPYNSRSPYAPVPNPASRGSSEALVGHAADMAEVGNSRERLSEEHDFEDAGPLAGRQPAFPIIGFQNSQSGRRVL